MNILERIMESSPGMELWWDSSPLIYYSWAENVLGQASGTERDHLERFLKAGYDPIHPERQIFSGVTTNPMLSLDVLKSDVPYWKNIVADLKQRFKEMDMESLFFETYKYIIEKGSNMYLPLFESSNFKKGFVSAQVDVRLVNDVESMVRQAEEIASINPNIMIKVPGSKAGYEAIKILTSKGIATNNTLTFVLPQLINCAKSVNEGLEIAKRNSVDLSRWRSVITFMESRFGDLGDLKGEAEKDGISLSDGDIRLAELAIFKKAYKILTEGSFNSKLLCCSLKVGPEIDGKNYLWHLEHKMGADIVITLPPKFLKQILSEEIVFDAQGIGVHSEIPEDLMKRLMKIEYFQRAYSTEGFGPDEYAELPSFKKTLQQHEHAINEMIRFCSEMD